MSEPRLAAGIEASAFVRRVEGLGGFGAILHKGDPERGTLILSVAERGVEVALLERRLASSGDYRWERTGPDSTDSQAFTQYLARAVRNDPDCWVIELDVPSAERFVAETTSST